MRKHLFTILALFAAVCILADTTGPFPDKKKDRVSADTIIAGNDSLVNDSTIISPDDTTHMDSLTLAIWHHNKAIDDSIRLDSINRAKKNGIDAPVKYTAEDSLVYRAGSKTAYLFGNSTVDYESMNLQSDKIHLSLDSSLVHAMGSPDSTAEDGIKGKPVFKMGQDTYDTDTMSFNFKTKKGFIKNVNTQQQDGFLTSRLSKRDADGSIYLKQGRYTTCDAPHPDFYIALSRAKVGPVRTSSSDRPISLWPTCRCHWPSPTASSPSQRVTPVDSSCLPTAMSLPGDSTCVTVATTSLSAIRWI